MYCDNRTSMEHSKGGEIMATFEKALNAWKKGKVVYRKADKEKWYLGKYIPNKKLEYFGMTRRKNTNDVRGCFFQEDILATDWVIE